MTEHRHLLGMLALLRATIGIRVFNSEESKIRAEAISRAKEVGNGCD